MNKTTEWKRIKLNDENLDFTGAKNASLECDGDTFISLTLVLKDGRTVRIRKADYGVYIEAPVIPMQTLFEAKVGKLTAQFNSRKEAEDALGDQDGQISEIQIAKKQILLSDEIPF